MNAVQSILLVALVTVLTACPFSPRDKDDNQVRCNESSDCTPLETTWGVDFTCDPELKLCVTLSSATDGGHQTCNPTCPTGQTCDNGTCTVDGPTVTIRTPEAGDGVMDNISVMAEVVPGPAGVETVTCQAGDQQPVVALQRGGTGSWSCDLTLGGEDGPRAVVVTATDPDGRSGSDQVTVIRDTTRPSISVTLTQTGITGPLDANSEVWPTGVDGHGPLQISVVVNEENFLSDRLTVEIPRAAGLPAFAPVMSCATAGITYACGGLLDLKPADFAIDETRGPQVVYATVTDLAGNQAEDSAHFHVDDLPPQIQDSGCFGLGENSDGAALRNTVVECGFQVNDDETDVDGTPAATVTGLTASDISVTISTWPVWKVSADLSRHSFDTFDTTLDISISARDLWGNSTTVDLQKDASRLRWQQNLGGDLLSPALSTDGHIYVVSNNAAGDADLHSLSPASGAIQQSRGLTLSTDEVIMAGPAIQQRDSDRATLLHLLTSTGSITTLSDFSGNNLSVQRPAPRVGYAVDFRSLPVISSDGNWAYAVVERSNQNFAEHQTGIEAVGANYSGSTCVTSLVPGYMGWASAAAFTTSFGGVPVTVIYAADQEGNAVFGSCNGCNCTTYRDDPSPARWGGISATAGGFLYPADATIGVGTADEVEWGTWTPLMGTAKPNWRAGRLSSPTLSAGPVHDSTWVVAGGGTNAGYDLLAAQVSGTALTMGSDYGDVAILDIVLAADGSNWILRKPAASSLEIANVAVGTTLRRWSGSIGGVNAWPAKPTIGRPGMMLEPGTQSLIVPHGGLLSSVIVDSQATTGWPMGRANPRRTACLPGG